MVVSNQVSPRKGDTRHLDPGNKRDHLTPFRWFLARCQYRAKDRRRGRGPTDLTLEYLQTLWETQRGICPFTGWSLILPHNTNGWGEATPKNASLDRIDNTKGYVQGNVRYIAVMANYARRDFQDSDLIDFCKAVAKGHNEEKAKVGVSCRSPER